MDRPATYGRPGGRDIEGARQCAEIADVPHRTLHWGEDYLSVYARQSVERAEGLLNCLNSHGFALHAMTEECQVAMLGNGGDSFFYIYRSYRPQLLAIQGDLTSAFFRGINHLLSEREAIQLFSRAYYPRVKGRAFASLVLVQR